MSDREAQMTKNASFILAKKEMKLLFKSKRRIFLLSITPLMILLIGVIAVGAVSFANNNPPDPTNVWVINDSPSNQTEALIALYGTVNNTEITEVSQSLDELRDGGNFEIIVYIPSNFTTQLQSGDPAEVLILYNGNSTRNQNIAIQFAQLTTFYEQQLIRAENPDVQFNRLAPVIEEKEEEDTGGITEDLASQLFIIPVYIIFFVVIPPISLIMISVTIEREEETLETLFLQPVPRNSIMMGKILYGIGIVVLVVILDIISALIDVILFRTFVNDGDLDELDSLFTELFDLIGADLIFFFLVTTLIISILVVGLAVLLSLIAKDEREANLISGILPLVLFSMIFIVQIVELSVLSFPVQLAMSAIPLIGILVSFYLSLVSGSLGLGALVGTVSQSLWIWFVIRFAARLSESESILELTAGKVFEELKNMILFR